jgi:hypothetical protein
MGKIQQAFNQALSIGAIAVGPMVATKKQTIAEREKLNKAQEKLQKQIDIEAAAADEALKDASKKPKEDGKTTRGKSLETQLDARKSVANVAYKKFEQNPTKENYDSYLEHKKAANELEGKIADKKEKSAKKAAESVSAERDQYRDQIAMLRSVAESVRWGSTQRTDKGGAK